MWLEYTVRSETKFHEILILEEQEEAQKTTKKEWLNKQEIQERVGMKMKGEKRSSRERNSGKQSEGRKGVPEVTN